MEEKSIEFKTVRKCAPSLETALKGLDRNMVDFLYQNGFITSDVCSAVLDPVTLLTPADKARKLVEGIKDRVDLDKESYNVLFGGLVQGGVLYQPIVNILTEEYQRQLIQQAPSTSVHVPTTCAVPDKQHQQHVCK